MNLADFHFLRPLFLIGIPILIFLAWGVTRQKASSNWARYLSASQLQALTLGQTRVQSALLTGLATAWVLACLALAGPTWEQRPTPAGANRQPLVVLFDQSPSMLAGDVTPDRLTRARLKLIDLLRTRQDGETALIAYADTPHLVAPLTEDARTIEALLPALTPAIMPRAGSNTEDAFELALELIENAGYLRGDILLVTDGVAPEAQRELQRRRPANIRLSILGVGTQEGAPIPTRTGFMRDRRDQIIVASLNRSELQTLASSMNGRYSDLLPNDQDIEYLLDGFAAPDLDTEEDISSSYDQWYDMGYWLCLLLLPFVLYAWRKGVVFILVLGLPALTYSPRSDALEWQDLWLTPDQQGQRALDNHQYQEAAENFERPDLRGYSQYRSGDYAGAVDSLSQGQTANDFYNLGNALAQSGRFEDAIAAYDQTLQLNPDHEDAEFNRQLMEDILDQQQNQQAGDSQQQSDESDSSEQSQSDQQSSSSSSQSDSSSDEQQQNQQNSQAQSDPEQNQPEEEGEEQNESSDTTSEEESGQDEQQREAQQMAMESSEEPLSASSEQWLRGVPDDPSGLLRRKFQYESDLYQRQQRFMPPQPNNISEGRY